MSVPAEAEFLAALDNSHVAMELYFSGLASGAASVLINAGVASDAEAREFSKTIVQATLADPIAMTQLGEALHAIIYDTGEAPRSVVTYGFLKRDGADDE